MPMTCCVPNCKTGYKSEEKSKKESIPLFSTSNKELLAKWSKAVPRKDYVFTKFSRVCTYHFDESDIIKGYSMLVEGKPTFVPYKRLRLKPDAVPCIFRNCPAYLSINLKKRKCPKKRLDTTPRPRKKPSLGHCSTSLSTDTAVQSIVTATTGLISIDSISIEPARSIEIEAIEIEPARSIEIEAIEIEPAVAITISSTTTTIRETAIQKNTSTTGWETELKKICFPLLWTYQQIGANLFSLFQTEILNGSIKIVKGITLNQNSLTYSVNGKSYTPQYFPSSVATAIELEQVIQKFEEAKICPGVSIADNLKLTCKLLESDTCYKEVQSSNHWKSYQCETLLFHSTGQEKSKSSTMQEKSKSSTVQEKSKSSTVHSCGCCKKLKAYVAKWMWKEKNQSCGKIARCRMTMKNSKRILSRKITKLNRLRYEITAVQKSTKVTSKRSSRNTCLN